MITRVQRRQKFRNYWNDFKVKDGEWNINRQSRRQFWKMTWSTFRDEGGGRD